MELQPGKTKRIETQLLHFDGAFWQAYSYMWRDDQADADLVPFDGAEKVFRVADKRVQGGEREQVWNFASRPQCLTCHNANRAPGSRVASHPVIAPYPTLRVERKCWAAGDRIVVGIDEVGRGSWAGPVTVCAVVPGTEHLAGVRD